MGIVWVGQGRHERHERRRRLGAAQSIAGWLGRAVLWIERREAPELIGAKPVERAEGEAAAEAVGERRAEPHAESPGPGGFEAFFHEHERRIFGYLVRLTGDEQTAHDLTQETFLRAWLHFARIARYDAPAAWLFRVATNLAVSHRRRRGSPVGSAQLFGDDSGPVRSDPTRHYVERDAIQQTLMELSENQRAALVLREVYGLSCEEIARTLGISRDAAKVTLFRARERFRARYAQAAGEAP
ncbi:MAG TPA: RNA polymerase sigma factor [Ktedonobacterales bacterium]